MEVSGSVPEPGPAEYGGCVGRSSPQSRLGRDAFAQSYARGAFGQSEGSGHQVVVVGDYVGARTLENQARSGRIDLEFVVEIEGDHLGVDEVESVGPQTDATEAQGQLGRREQCRCRALHLGSAILPGPTGLRPIVIDRCYRA